MSSLPALALLITATNALRETVAAQGAEGWLRVEMAPRDALALAEEMDGAGDKRAIACLYLGDETHKMVSRRWFDGTRTVELVVQILLPPFLAPSFGGAAVPLDTKSGGGAEAAYTASHRLLELAFAAPDKRSAPGVSSWGALYQAVVTSAPSDFEGRPFLAATKNNVELPVIDYSIGIPTINSPPPGDVQVQTQGFWAELVAKMRADTRASALADFVAALVAGKVLPPWQAEQVLAGLSDTRGTALGIGTLRGLDDQPAANTLSITTPRGDVVVSAGEGPDL